ncbi:MAG: hypothetical protein J0G94_11350 [Sphingomonadales bacterium]|nr:hypothetical protein [Sphingomonadales bacterium]
MRGRFGIGALCLTLLSLPAQAAENLACVTKVVDQKLARNIFKAYRADQNIGEALMARVGDKVAACSAANDWSEEALESAIRVVLGQILTSGVLGELKPFRVKPDALRNSTDRFLSTLPEEKLRLFVDGELTGEEGGDIVKQLLGDEVIRLSQINDKLGSLIGEYAAGRANETFFTAQFARQ